MRRCFFKRLVPRICLNRYAVSEHSVDHRWPQGAKEKSAGCPLPGPPALISEITCASFFAFVLLIRAGYFPKQTAGREPNGPLVPGTRGRRQSRRRAGGRNKRRGPWRENCQEAIRKINGRRGSSGGRTGRARRER